MPAYTLSATLDQPHDRVLEAVRAALDDQGFGVLTEIDLQTTLKAKLDVDVAPQVILGACRPALAYEAMQADPSIGAVLPCNVVVRATGERTTVVEAFDPNVMLGISESGGLETVAADARERLTAMLTNLSEAQ